MNSEKLWSRRLGHEAVLSASKPLQVSKYPSKMRHIMVLLGISLALNSFSYSVPNLLPHPEQLLVRRARPTPSPRTASRAPCQPYSLTPNSFSCAVLALLPHPEQLLVRCASPVSPEDLPLIGQVLEAVNQRRHSGHRQEGDERSRVRVDQDYAKQVPHCQQHTAAVCRTDGVIQEIEYYSKTLYLYIS